MAALLILFTISITVPTLLAVVASWHDVAIRNVRLVRHAPKRRYAATVLLYHTDLPGTLSTLRQLRRIRAVRLAVVIVAPADAPLTGMPHSMRIHRKQNRASRELTLRSAYTSVDPTLPLCIIDSGDTLPAATIHSALHLFRTRPQVSRFMTRSTGRYDVSFYATLMWLRSCLRHVLRSFEITERNTLQAGTWLRSGTLLRQQDNHRMPYLSKFSTVTPPSRHLPELSPLAFAMTMSLLAISVASYMAALLSLAILPLVAFWVSGCWWFVTLASVTPAPIGERLRALAIAPLAGIVTPVWWLLLVAVSLGRSLRQRLAGARRQYAEHGIFFRLGHP